jgi:hypothetical protein
MPFISSVRGTYGGLGKTGITAPYALISYAGTVYNMASSTITFSSPGEYSIFLPFASKVRARVWGAGGGGSQPGGWGGSSVGGSGGFSTGIVSLPSGTSKILVGEGGNGNTARFVYGGGRSAQPNGGETDNRYSACGGGFSGILSGSGTVHDSTPSLSNTTYTTAALQARAIIIAGGGGGGGNASGQGENRYVGGHGGGSSGTGGYVNASLQPTTAGSQSSTGSNSWGDQWGGRIPATYMGGSSGSGQGYGAGGGGGYFAGSSGENSTYMSGAGGGSGFIHPSLVTSGSTSAGSGQTSPGGNGTTGYVGGVGYGGNTGSNSTNSWNGGAGGGGLVILTVI